MFGVSSVNEPRGWNFSKSCKKIMKTCKSKYNNKEIVLKPLYCLR